MGRGYDGYNCWVMCINFILFFCLLFGILLNVCLNFFI